MRTGRRDWLWGTAIGVVTLATVAVVYFSIRGGSSVETYAEVDGVKCQNGEQLDYHIHAHLSILLLGDPVAVPAQTGIRDDCLFWLHTHDDTGLIHVEAPSDEDFTLGQFMMIWGQPLSETTLLDHTAKDGMEITATVNGEQVPGDPSLIVFEDQQSIVLQLGPPFGEHPESPFD